MAGVKRQIFIASSVCFATVFDCASDVADLTGNSIVDPFVGTSATGHTFPGACVPFGMVQASPGTGTGSWDYCSGYR